MNKVSREAIKQLLETEDTMTLSIYMPAHRFPTSEHISEDKIRFKNLLRTAKEMLEKDGIDEGVTAQMLGQLESIHSNDDFWQHTTQGMAFFCSLAGLRYFHLPIECDEYVSVGDCYDVAPLLIVASYDQPYYLLALATKNPALFYGDMYDVRRVAIHLPTSIEEALNIDELHSNSRTDRAGGHGAGSKAHGQGDSRQAGQEERLKFFRIIDDTLSLSREIDTKIPILLSGTEDDISGYRESSKLKHLLNATLHGNYVEISNHEIHDRSWPLIMRELNDQMVTHEIEKIQSLAGTGLASLESEEISEAAKQGRADTLLLGMLTKTRDSISDVNEVVTKIVFTERYVSDKIDALVRSVFDQGGKIVGVLRGDMPREAYQAAVYRY